MTDTRTAVAAAEPDEPDPRVRRVQQIMGASAVATTGRSATSVVALDPFEHPTGARCSDPWCEDK